MLTKRIDTAFPNNWLTTDPSLSSAYTVLQSIWSREYAAFYRSIREAKWNEMVGILAERVLGTFVSIHTFLHLRTFSEKQRRKEKFLLSGCANGRFFSL